MPRPADLSSINPVLLSQVESLRQEGLDIEMISQIIDHPYGWVIAVAQSLELSRYERSSDPVMKALLDLYRYGLIHMGGFHNGQIIWLKSH